MDNKTLPLPDVWSRGQLFDFSGLDGQTSWLHPATGLTLGARAGFEFKSAVPKTLWVALDIDGFLHEAPLSAGHHVVCSDLVDLVLFRSEWLTAEVAFVYCRQDLVLSRVALKGSLCCKSGTPVKVYAFCSCNSIIEAAQKNDGVIIRSANERAVLRGRFRSTGAGGKAKDVGRTDFTSLPFKSTGETATVLAELDLVSAEPGVSSAVFSFSIRADEEADAAEPMPDFAAEYEWKLDFFRRLPVPDVEDLEKLKTLAKAFSVLKVNTYAPEGDIKCRWTTPDRWPHRHLWLWDSAFQALGYKHISGQMGEDAIRAMLSVQAADGYVPLCACPEWREIVVDGVRETQPPTLAWAAWDVYQHTGNKEFLRYCLPRLARFMEWLFQNKDQNHNGLLEWYVRVSCKICPCGESGMDNASRFLTGAQLDAIDLNALVANEIRHIGLMCREVGEGGYSALVEKGENLARLINEKMWDEKDGFYYDLLPNGEQQRIRSIASFFTLLAGIPDSRQAEQLVRHMTDPDEFWSEFPVRTLSAREPGFDRNMWRGPIWLNCNYIVIAGLRRYGYDNLAERIAERTLEEVSKWYGREGSIFELYHDMGLTPLQLPRKDSAGGPEGSVLRDYGWSCGVYIQLLLEK